MDKREKTQLLADQIQPLLMMVDGFAEQLEEDDIELLKECKDTLLNHINMQQSAITLTMAFGFEPDTTEEEFKAKTLEILIELINTRKEYKRALIAKAEQERIKAKNRAELMNIFGNL